MNQLNVSLQHSIATLAANGWSARRIARELGVHRETVGRYLRPPEPDSKPAIPPTGSEEDAEAKPAIVPAGSRAGRTSQCAPLKSVIEQGLLAGLSAQRIYQDLVVGHGFAGGYDAVKRFVRRLVHRVEPPFRRLECAPGAELQVDFGQGAWVVENGKRRRPHLFRIVLSHSRKAYSQAVWRQTTESFLRCLENAFRHFGGVTATVVIDNLKAGVLQADWFDPELNPKLEEFARHYGTVILPTKPVTPRHKGKIEAGVKYAQNNALKGRNFESLAAQNLFLAQWEKNTADTRLHGTTRQQVGKLFETVERPALRPLPAGLFPVFEEARPDVHLKRSEMFSLSAKSSNCAVSALPSRSNTCAPGLRERVESASTPGKGRVSRRIGQSGSHPLLKRPAIASRFDFRLDLSMSSTESRLSLP